MSVPLVRVGELAEQIRGVSYGKQDASNSQLPGYLPVLRAGNITDEGLVFSDLVFVPAERISGKQRIRRYDVVIAASSGSIDVVGKAAPALLDYDGGFGAFCKVLRPNAKIEPHYFAHFFKTRNYRQRVSGLAAGANINNLRNEDLDNLAIPLPPLPEQRRIADVLDRAEALRAKRRAALAELDELTQSVFLDMFGDPMLHQKKWKTCLLDEVTIKITDGTHKTPIYKDTGIEFLSAKDLKDGGIAWGTGKFISAEEHRELVKRCNPEVGDVLLAKSGSLGNVAIVDCAHQFSLFESLCLIKLDRKLIEGQYLIGLLRTPSMLAHLLGKNKGVAIKHLHLVDVRNLRIPLPPVMKQREFAERVAAVERVKAVQRASLAELDELFAALQQRAFRGEL